MPLKLLRRWIERSISNETATKIVKTSVTDHVGVKAKDRVSFSFSSIPNTPNCRA